jgi:3-phenylpropionate/trans-cinnamate dioxygenase ferredoxin subunit
VKHRLGSVEDFPAGSCRILDVGRRSVGVYRLEDGSFFAVRNSCPHHGAPICIGHFGGTMLPSEAGEYKYGLSEHVVRCPWHGWEFDITTGRALFDIDKSRLVTYPVTVEDGDVFVEGKAL